MTLTNLTTDITHAAPTPDGMLPGKEADVPAFDADSAADMQHDLHEGEGADPTQGASIITTDAPD